MSYTDKFYEKKKEWSIVKDDLLSYYLEPYFMKILEAGSLLYIDCFAGAGKFNDGQNGSPLIALNKLNEVLEKKKEKYGDKIYDFMLCFIEPYYYDLLKENICSHELKKKTKVFEKSFKESILTIIKENKKRNLFLYVDPFGIKYLSFNIIDTICSQSDIFSKEILINFNSFGFFREACRRKQISEKKLQELDELIGKDLIDPFELDDNKMLDEIIGSNSWEEIIDEFSKNRIDAKKAENMISELFRKRLNKNFNYVLDLPIKNKSKNIPKYRMVFGTNHEDGCEIMYSDISARKKQLAYYYTGGQLSLLSGFDGNEYVDMNIVNKKFYDFLHSIEPNISENKLIAKFCTEFGTLCSCQELKSSIKDLEIEQILKFKKSGKKRYLEKIDKEKLQ